MHRVSIVYWCARVDNRAVRARVAFGVVVALFVAFLVGNAQAGADYHSKEFVQGAITTFSDRPFDAPITQPICRDYRLFYARIGFNDGGGPTNRGKEPFRAVLEISTFDVVAEELIALEVGDTTDVTGSYDKTHLKFARMGAPGPIELFNVDLATGETTPSGRTATLGSVTWTGSGDLSVFGNDGPFLEEIGLARHFVNACELLNFHAHQKLRPAQVGSLPLSIDGAAVSAPFHNDPAGFIINHWFHIVHVAKNCG
jgi:hypothetical protein